MKNLLLFLTLLFFCSCASSQNSFPPERIIIIADLENDIANFLDFQLSDLSIESKIIRILKLDEDSISLTNPKLINENQKGWYLNYEFETSEYTGIYKEHLRLRDGQLVITESRNAMMAIATNCDTLIFTDDEERSKCIDKKDDALDSVITYRLFFSAN